LNIGGSTRISTGAFSVIASVTLGTWKLHCLVTTRTTGGSGTQIANCQFVASGTTLTAGDVAPMQTSSTWTIDTTVGEAIDLTAAWDATTGSPTISSSNVAAWIPGAPVTSVNGSTGAVTTTAPGMVLVEEHTAASSSTLNFTTGITSTYDDYDFRCTNLVPSTNNVSFFIRVSTNGGSTYDSSAIYDLNFVNAQNGTITGGQNTNQTGFGFVGGVSTTANYSLSCVVRLSNPLSASLYKMVNANCNYFNTSGNLYMNFDTAFYKSTTAVNAFQAFFDSGTISSGVCRLYGLSH
jgi:hypothetical protein